MNKILTNVNYSLDLNTGAAFRDIIQHNWDFDNIYSVEHRVFMFVSADKVLDFFVDHIPGGRYRIFCGDQCVIWNDSVMVEFSETFRAADKKKRLKFDSIIVISGVREVVVQLSHDFQKHFESNIREDYQTVQLAMLGRDGLDYATLPIKSEQVFYPAMYPGLKPDPYTFIDDYLNSPANVLILMGEPGMGKSALINQIILTAKKRTHVVYDKEVMSSDQVYTDFINHSLQNEGGLMILEDADTVLSDRIVSKNETMSKLLNISDGIIDTSKAKFIFSANITETDDIDTALTRPGRCFDIINFKPLNREEAEYAAQSIGKELPFDKDYYTVAEIFNAKFNIHERKHKVGFI